MIDVIDTHCHLSDEAFDADRVQVVERMRAAGVGRALVIESELERLESTIAWVGKSSGIALATGCHPHDATAWSPDVVMQLRTLWSDGTAVAAGEMGLDYHYDHSPRALQLQVFEAQLALAAECGLPAVIHAREADDDVVSVLKNQPDAVVVLHSFSSGTTLRQAGLKYDWYFSFSGMVTFKSWTDLDSVRLVRDDRLLIETDSPYLAPVPHRGKRNEPAFVVEVAERVAAIREHPPEQVSQITSDNANRLFGRGWTN